MTCDEWVGENDFVSLLLKGWELGQRLIDFFHKKNKNDFKNA